LWEIGGYFVEPPDEAALALLAAAFDARTFAVSEVPDTDWVAHVRRELAPVEAGRFYVYGSHDADTVPEGCVPLLIEAAMAFGTGHHGTTKGCLEAFDALLDQGLRPSSVADVGCGTAVLAIAAAKVLDVRVLASDIDAVAVDVTLANLRANNALDRVECFEAIGFNHEVYRAAGGFDLIFANILKGPLVDLAPDVARNLRPGGHVILSGLLTEQAEEVDNAYRAEGLLPVTRRTLGEWATLTLKSP
jgi:ribosomal protein L11 methyltransferase